MPRWVPHTTPSSLPDQRARLAGVDHQLACLDEQSERVGRGGGSAADRGGERRPGDGDDDGDVVGRRHDGATRPGGDTPRAGGVQVFMMTAGRVWSHDGSRLDPMMTPGSSGLVDAGWPRGSRRRVPDAALL